MSEPMKVSHNWIRQQLSQGFENLLSVIPEGDEPVVVMEGDDGKLYRPDHIDTTLGLLAAFAASVHNNRVQGYAWDTIRRLLRECDIDSIIREGTVVLSATPVWRESKIKRRVFFFFKLFSI